MEGKREDCEEIEGLICAVGSALVGAQRVAMWSERRDAAVAREVNVKAQKRRTRHLPVS